ncbi:MAG: right-handed parallel beta-helix repeat-containing protein [Phycisphaerales bacterium]|nr:MAG: right-handed parallel beta-helix repeat-containing protein [Phycisphaerales bacterium]
MNIAVLALLMRFGLSVASAQTVIYVDDDALPDGDCTAWTTACRYLQDAMAIVTNGDDIHIANGIYKPDRDGTNPDGTGDREATFQLIAGVGLYGGYRGLSGGGDPDDRDISMFETVLSGDLAGNDEPDFANRWDNAFHVVTANGVPESAVLDGFTIVGGNADFEADQALGGGMYAEPGSPTVANCRFSDNLAEEAGGGVYNGFASNTTLINCEFVSNSSGYGGAMANSGNSPTLTNCAFIGNSAYYDGGGIDNYESSPTLVNCVFTDNFTDYHDGGAMHNSEGSSPSLTNCILWGNRDSGGTDESAQIHGGIPLVNYSCIQDVDPDDVSVFPGTGNTDDDPAFVREPDPGLDGNWDGVDDDFGDLHLACASPCVDSGTNTTTPPLPAIDLDGNPRVVNGVVDMGPYEGPNQAFIITGAPVNVLEGQDASFTVALACDPGTVVNASVDHDAGDVDITVGAGGDPTFDSSNFSIPQTVTLSAAEDGDQAEGTARFRITATGIAFGSVTACEFENDTGPVVYVDAHAGGADNGTDWTDALNDLGEALLIAAASPKAVNEVWVAAATYTPAGPGGDRSATFQLVSDTAVYGGFAGWETSLDQRDSATNVTILSGDLNGDDGPGFANNSENSCRVVDGSGTDETAILDGFAITGGNATGVGGFFYSGGGMHNRRGSPTVANCLFTGNSAQRGGGGMYNWVSNPTLANCTFSGNRSVGTMGITFGGGMFNASSSSPALTRCIFVGNSAVTHGGGMYNDWHSSPTLTNCIFAGNSAGYDGGGMYNYDNTPMLTNCSFSGNTAGWDGGGMYNYRTTSTMSDCTFVANSASNGQAVAYDSPYQNYPSTAHMTNCIFWGSEDEVWNNDESTITITFSDVQGGWPGEGNINADPSFVDADGPDDIPGTEDDNLRLAIGSPCIDAGDNTAVPPDVADLDGDGDMAERTPLDLGNVTRFTDDLDTPDSGIADPPDYPYVVDMGAHEFYPPVPAITEWTVGTMALLALALGPLVFRRCNAPKA